MNENLNEWTHLAHRLAVNKGFWDSRLGIPRDFLIAQKIALIHAELSELLETYRNQEESLASKVDGLRNDEEEFADIFLRLADLAGYVGVKLGDAVCLKHQYNESRPHKHGKQF